MHRRFSALLLLLIPLLVSAEQAPVPMPRPKWRGEKSIAALAEEETGVFAGDFKDVQNSDFDSWPERVYVDPDLTNLRITREPGQSWADCRRDAKNCVSLPNAKTQIFRDTKTPPKVRTEVDLFTGNENEVQYIKVRFKDASGEGEGWIETTSLRSESLAPIYQDQPVESVPNNTNAPCPDDAKKRPMTMTSNQKDLQRLSEMTAQGAQTQLDASVEALQPFLGQCYLKPPTEKKPGRWNKKIVYDVEVLPKLAAQKKEYPFVLRSDEQGSYVRKVNVQDMVAIDTLARTLYSEMNECFAMGIHYPMAVAKVAVNRAKKFESTGGPWTFVKDGHAASKPTLSRVLTAPNQFAVWNSNSGPKDKTLLMALCPARDEDSANNWKGHKPSPADLQAWNLSVKIATDAVLFSNRFEAKTSEVDELYYTSKRTELDGRKKATPSIQGRKVDSFKCIQLWEGQ